jgi:nucleoside phosphorylase
VHHERKAIARYLLSRGSDPASEAGDDAPPPAHLAPINFPSLTPQPAPIDPAPQPSDGLPSANVVVVTWTADEADALAHVFTPGFSFRPAAQGTPSKKQWYAYAHNFDTFLPDIRPGAPARGASRLGSYLPVKVGEHSVLCMKSELHLNQDGISAKDAKGKTTGLATLPVKDLFKQIIAETGAGLILTIGTAGSVYDDFQLGDVVVTRAAKFKCAKEFRNEPFNHQTYKSDWKVPQTRFADAQQLMSGLVKELKEPPVGAPTAGFDLSAELQPPPVNDPDIKLDGSGELPAFHPILTTDYFEYGTTVNRLDAEGAGVEMGDAALGLACSELAHPPNWAVVRNMSDPVINGKLPATDYHLNEQTTWAVAYYTAYGKYTSMMGAIATWAIIAGLA